MVTCPSCGAGNAEGHRFYGNCGSLLEQARIKGERKFASFLFADVAHSTASAEGIDPDDWTLVMNGAFGFMNEQFAGALLRLGRHQEAAGAIAAATAYYRGTGMRPYLARTLDVAARMHEQAGRTEEAARAREHAQALRLPVPLHPFGQAARPMANA